VRVLTVRDLGALIRARRRQLGLDQKTLAERVGVSRYWIIDIEHGKERAEVGLVLQTLRFLELQVDVTEQAAATGRGSAARGRRPSADDLIASALKRRR